MTPDLRPPPQPDSTTKFFWDAAADHRLVLQRCSTCGFREYPPEVVCTECQGEDFEYAALSGRGTLFSFAVVERAFHPGFVAHLPYVVAMVELVEQPGLRLLTNVVDADP
ncbi:MAG TPA: OB-fold domain-containing protein, partial [Acidimicrobiales bacterium]|nr:OB-fold domain-containing protein [Acidimicrobiales bacterium]